MQSLSVIPIARHEGDDGPSGALDSKIALNKSALLSLFAVVYSGVVGGVFVALL